MQPGAAIDAGRLPITWCRITKLPGFRGRTDEMAINMEWGDFQSPALPRLEEDLWIDLSSPNPGRHLACGACWVAGSGKGAD